jgi:predicted metalloprotease with PDZ domain
MRTLLVFYLAILIGFKINAQDTLYYKISFPNHIHHEAKITLSLKNIKDDSLIFRVSSSSPGRYAPHQFAKNIYDMHGVNSEGKAIEIFKIEPDCWLIPDHDGTISLTYTLFADHPDGTYAGIDRDFALLNMPASMLWWDQGIQLPIILEFVIPEESTWRIGTQLKSLQNPNKFLAPNLDYLMDSLVILSDFNEDTLYFSDTDRISQQIRIIYNPQVDEKTSVIYTDMIRKVVLEQQAIFGELPSFDFGSYIFLNNYGAGYKDDGMEHRNSTLITSYLRLPGNEKELIGSVAHEFFHCWNVERIRPESLEPFDFTQANMSGELWFAEGFTSYYASLTCRRAGIYSNEDFLSEISNTLNYVMNIPGRNAGSPVYMSQMAPFIDAAIWIDEMNVNNVYISYYNYGMVIGLALDLALRSLNKEISLDDYMRFLRMKYGRNEIPYHMSDLRNALIEISGDPVFANSFFEKFIFRNELPDFQMLLSHAGFDLKLKHSFRSWLGYHQFDFSQTKARLLTYPLKADPLYLAGIEKSDEILTLDALPINSYEMLEQTLTDHLPGETLRVEFLHFDDLISSKIILQQDPTLTILSKNQLSKKESIFRESWLSSRIKP